MKAEIRNILEKAVKSLIRDKKIPIADIGEVLVDIPGDSRFGDYFSNVALQIAGKTGKDPKEVADLIIGEVKSEKDSDFFAKIDMAGAGFLNFYVSDTYLKKQVRTILKQKNKFGSQKPETKSKINVEFISANPTGPLTLGNGRGGFCGDVLSNVLKCAGNSVTREYYINDTGNQIKQLGQSVIGEGDIVYRGEYINDLRKKISGDNALKAGEKAAKIILGTMIKCSVKKMGIKFDVWFSEKGLYSKKTVDMAIKELQDKGLTYEKDGALWFKSSKFGDDKDRVLIRENGEKTYIASDIAYLKNKFSRGFNKLVLFLGADHYGYIGRLKAATEAIGYDKDQISIVIMQLVRLFKDGKEVRMSKRTGSYVTLDELIDEVGLDAARFFFLSRSSDTHLNFDMNLAKEQSQKNPVYYSQYAYARICSILRKSKFYNYRLADLNFLSQKEELFLIKQLMRLPEIVGEISGGFQTQKLPQLAIDISDAFHKFYEKCRVINDDDKKITYARLALVMAAKITLKNIFDLMGISAPEKM